MTLDEISQKEDISVRSLNVCDFNELKDLAAILNYYQEYKSFKRLRNCGSKSNDELCQLCLKYLDRDSSVDHESPNYKKSLFQTVSELETDKIHLINRFIEININDLSNRAKNALINYLNGELTLDRISESIIFNDRFKFSKIRSAGSKTILELESFINSIKIFIDKVNSSEKLNSDEIKSNLQNENTHVDLIEINRDPIIIFGKSFSLPIEVISQKSIFKTVDYLLNHSIIFDKNSDFIFKNTFKIFHDQPGLTLYEIAESMTISRERVRQIRNECLKLLVKKFNFIKKIHEDIYQKYNLDISSDYLVIDNEKRDLINSLNESNFSKEFISIITYIYKSEKFELVGEPEDVILFKSYNSQNRHNWDNLYLVSKELSSHFSFNSFANDVNERLSERINETYKFNILGYLFNFLKTSDKNVLSVIQPVAEIILNHEFEMFIDSDDNIVFSRSTNKLVHEYAIEALEKLGVPSKLDDIYNLIVADNPEITKSTLGLRGSLQRNNEIIYFGRSSTYGLKKWEDEYTGIKGGTIKDIIIDFLKDKKQPIHINVILDYLKKFRGHREERSVITNLKVDPQKRFIIYSQGFIGLKENYELYSKKYEKLTSMLGKNIISKYRIGYSISELITYLQINYNLNADEASHIINSLKYFNEIK